MKNLTWNDIVFIGRTMQDNNRGGEAVYVGVFGEYDGEPFQIEDYTKDEQQLTLNIYESKYKERRELAARAMDRILTDLENGLKIIYEES